MENKIISLTPMLETSEIKSTIEFYTNILGFNCESYSEEGNWAHLKKDNISIMFSLPNDHRSIPGPSMSGSLYLNIENVDLIWDKIKDKCNICYPVENFEYGMKEFAIYDNNGYLLQFGQEIKQA